MMKMAQSVQTMMFRFQRFIGGFRDGLYFGGVYVVELRSAGGIAGGTMRRCGGREGILLSYRLNE